MVEIFSGFESQSFSRGGSIVGWEILGIDVLARLIERGKLILLSALLIVSRAILATWLSNCNSKVAAYSYSRIETLGTRIIVTQSY